MKNTKLVYVLLGICVALCITALVAAFVGNDDDKKEDPKDTIGYEELEDGDIEIDIGDLLG